VCSECGDDIREAAAGIMFAAGRCGDLPEQTFARTILANKFGGEFTEMAKEGAGVVDPMVTRTTSYVHSWLHHIHTRETARAGIYTVGFVLPFQLVWKLTGNKGDMELKKQVVKEVAAENNVLVDFSEPQEVEHGGGGNGNVPHHHKVSHEGIYQTDMDGSSEPDSYPCDISNSDGASNGHPKQENTKTSVRTRR
jgi:hypothetical protein